MFGAEWLYHSGKTAIVTQSEETGISIVCAGLLQAIEFVQMQQDDELWDLLITLALAQPPLTGLHALPCKFNSLHHRKAECYLLTPLVVNPHISGTVKQSFSAPYSAWQ